jgi:hypothetical protein
MVLGNGLGEGNLGYTNSQDLVFEDWLGTYIISSTRRRGRCGIII